MSERFRAATGGLIDRSRKINFEFDGQQLTGHPGDTLASALLANGQRIFGRSFKYHRPRGLFSAGVEEPNALVQLREGPQTEPNLRAPQVELFEGLVARSQNRWPSLDFDIGSVNNLLSSFFPAGFYYKTFMWPASMWMKYEHVIRRAAGLGESPVDPDPDRYDKRYKHCDVLVIGAGAAGIAAAASAAEANAKVVLVDDQPEAGGNLRNHCATPGEETVRHWAKEQLAILSSRENVTVLTRTTAFGYYDDNLVAAFERVADHVANPAHGQPRQRLWWFRAKRIVLTPGAIERPLVFGGNDFPGVMLAGSARTYADLYAVRPGSRAVVFTNNDTAYVSAAALSRVGVNVETVVDLREKGPGQAALQAIAGNNTNVLAGYAITEAKGSKGVQGARVARLAPDGQSVSGDDGDIQCDLICVSGGFSPSVHLHSQGQGEIRYDDELTAFIPGAARRPAASAGAGAGEFNLSKCIESGAQAGAQAATEVGFSARPVDPPAYADPYENPIRPLWVVPRARSSRIKRFVDLQNDVTTDDVELAVREGYRDVEHLKRYTTLGMGTDQGRTSNVIGLAILGALTRREIPQVGTTTFRPPFSPVTLGAMAGREVGHDIAPLRRTPLHHWHLQNGATLVNVGLWQRAQYYQRSDESMWDAIWREARSVRKSVGVVDVSTLGKIDIRGKDAAEFTHRVYMNRYRKLAVGKIRYGLMLREDGHIFDDGTTTHISPNHFYMTTTTGNAGPVMTHLEFYAQTVWPELDVHLTSVTDQWGGMALAGPRARDVLAAVTEGVDVSHESLPFMGYVEAKIDGVPVHLFRMTFSGELAYEIHAASDHLTSVWEAIIAAGKSFDITPYGTEAMSILRIEKGHVVGAELDGRTIAQDFGFQGMAKDEDFIGRRSLERPAFSEPRKTFVGLISDNGEAIPRGAQIVALAEAQAPVPMLGHVTANCYSPNLKKEIGLAIVLDGDKRMDSLLYAASPLVDKIVPVRVTNPVFIDPKGDRARG